MARSPRGRAVMRPRPAAPRLARREGRGKREPPRSGAGPGGRPEGGDVPGPGGLDVPGMEPTIRSGLVGLLLGDQPAEPLAEQHAVERLLERVVEAEVVQLLARLLARQRDEDRADVVLALAEVLRDLP